MTQLQPQTPSDSRTDAIYLLAFVAANLALKLSLVHFNAGSYTDAIIQLQTGLVSHDKFTQLGLYPPLYGQLAHILALTGLSLETAGRAVSAISGSLALIPIFYLTRLLFQRDAARISALLFTLSPLVLRWSSHAMTDSLFLALSASNLYFCVKAWSLAREKSPLAQMDSAFAWASAFAALATFTRYQGVLLGLPLLLAAIAVLRQRCFPVRALALSVLWLAPVGFAFAHRTVHTGQFADRTAGDLMPTLAAYWNTFESFVLIAPYYFGYPIAGLAIAGAAYASRGTFAVRPFLWVFSLWAVLLLALHAAFGSFQYRYIMPLLPGLLALAGHGAHQLYLAAKARGIYPLYSAAMMLSLAYLALFSTAVLVFQKQTLGDQKQAALYVKEHAAAGDQVFGNELYGKFTQLGCVKLSFWSGHKVDHVYNVDTGKPRDLPPGSWVILGNEYGGNEAMMGILQQLRTTYSVQEIEPTFSARVIPLMDDIMVDPLFNQNPMGWVLRYMPQTFFTRVLRVYSPAGTPKH